MRDRLDADGRPLGEQASPVYDSVPTDTRPCPHPGHRSGLPMNQSALNQLLHEWPWITSVIRGWAGPNATVGSAWRAAICGVSAPTLVAAGTPIPRRQSAMYKACVGFSRSFGALLLAADGVAETPMSTLGSSKDFVHWLENDRALIGQVEACAGSPAMIAAAFSAFCGTPGPTLPFLSEEQRNRFVQRAHTDIAVVLQQRAWGQALHELPPWLRPAVEIPGLTPAHVSRLGVV